MAPLHVASESSIYHNKTIHNITEMNEVIKQAAMVSLNLHESINGYKFPADIRVKYLALGQCLRSLIDILEDEHKRDQDTTA